MRSIFYVLVAITHVLAQLCIPIVPDPAPPASQTGLKQIPDIFHPFLPPGPLDQRGPCPGLNTMANHGYIPRSGIASLQQIVSAAQEAFNMEHTLASTLAAFGMLARGNACINQLSIGLPSLFVPPLPGNIDGNRAGGLATHGRFEGDVSMTRTDFDIGDNIHFNATLFKQLLGFVSEFGDDSPVTGPNSIVNVKVMQEFKFQRFLDDQANDDNMKFLVARYLLSYGENALTLKLFANGTDGTLSVPTMASFFQNQRFPPNWHRSATPVDGTVIVGVATKIISAHPISPGANSNGVYVNQTLTDSLFCSAYSSVGGNSLASTLAQTTGILKQNVNTLTDLIHGLFSTCTKVQPSGPAGV